MIAALCGLAFAEALLVAPAGDPLPGEVTTLRMVAWEGSSPAKTAPPLKAEAGTLLGVQEAGPGQWEVTWRAPDAGRSAAFNVEGVRVVLPLAEAPRSGLSAPERVDGRVGETVTFTVSGAVVLAAASAEGELQIAGDTLRFTPGSSRDPRAVPVGVRDAQRPERPAEWTVVRLNLRTPVTVTTEPGTDMSVKVGGRTYGPTTAGADGKATVEVELRPGETSGELQLVDRLGNRQRSVVSLAAEGRPALAALPAGSLLPGAPPPPISLYAVNPDGGRWTGPAPTCRAAGGLDLDVRPAAEGWVALLPKLPEGVFLDLRVDCSLGGRASTSTRLVVEPGLPSRVVLRVWPEELSADFPVAQVQAYVEDSRGERMDPTGLRLESSAGRLAEAVVQDRVLRADFAGAPEVAETEIRAVWYAPPSTDAVAGALLLGAAQEAQSFVVQVRAVDRAGRPLAGLPLEFDLGGSVVAVTTDDAGWATAPAGAPTPVRVVEVRGGGQLRRLVLLSWAQPAALALGAPDLSASVRVGIVTGRVRTVKLWSDPPQLYTGGGARAEIGVRLEDRSGRPVTDLPVTFSADQGEVSPPTLAEDGSWMAIYTPPPAMTAGDVTLSVRSELGAFPETSINLALEPRPVSRAPWVWAGGSWNLGSIRSPMLAAGMELELAPPLYLQVGAGWTRAQDSLLDDTGLPLELRLDNFPLSVALHRRWTWGLTSAWVGGGAALTPYRLVLTGTLLPPQGVSGAGLHRPGIELHAGAGRRVRGGELFVESRYLGAFTRTSTVGYEGQVGGLALGVGFRVVY